MCPEHIRSPQNHATTGESGQARRANALMLWVPRNRSSALRALPLKPGFIFRHE